jgi:hypothetical protein
MGKLTDTRTIGTFCALHVPSGPFANPATHRHRERDVLPAFESEFAGHAVHALSSCARYFPAAHAVHGGLPDSAT